MQAVVVTGASTGIGNATVRDLADYGCLVFANVRSEGDADRLREALGERVVPLVFDVRDADAIASAAEDVAARTGTAGLAGLVNNAGIAVTGPLMHMPVDEFRKQMEINLVGALQVTQAFLPLLGARKDAPHPAGRIVNISSVSGRFAMPFAGAYAASKFGLEAVSDCLRRELMIYGIDVIVIEPGRVRTPIWGKVGDLSRYENTDYGPTLRRLVESLDARLSRALPPERVASVIRRALTHPRPKARYPLPDSLFTGWILPRALPARWLDRLIYRMAFCGKHGREATSHRPKC